MKWYDYVDYVTFDDYGKINKVFPLNCLAKKGQSFISLRKDIFQIKASFVFQKPSF